MAGRKVRRKAVRAWRDTENAPETGHPDHFLQRCAFDPAHRIRRTTQNTPRLEPIAFDQVHLIKGDTKHNPRLACLGSPSI